MSVLAGAPSVARRRTPSRRSTRSIGASPRTFIAVQTGTWVAFPNSDDVRHHVYSFSRPNDFQIKLYHGEPGQNGAVRARRHRHARLQHPRRHDRPHRGGGHPAARRDGSPTGWRRIDERARRRARAWRPGTRTPGRSRARAWSVPARRRIARDRTGSTLAVAARRSAGTPNPLQSPVPRTDDDGARGPAPTPSAGGCCCSSVRSSSPRRRRPSPAP